MSPLVPMVVEQTSRGERSFDIYSRLLERADRLPRHAGHRGHRQPDRRPAPAPRVRGPRQGHQPLRQLARRLRLRRPGDLRHDAVHQARRADDLRRHRDEHGRAAAGRRRRRQADVAAQLEDPDPPGLLRLPGPGDRHRDPRQRDHRRPPPPRRDPRQAHRPALREGHQRHRPRLLHERGGGEGVQPRRPRHRAPLKRPAPLALLLLAALAAPASARIATGDGAVTYYDHVFPVQGPHGTRGYDRRVRRPRAAAAARHEGFDIVAACGTPLVAVRSGRSCAAGYDPVLYGNYLLIHGEGEDRSYFYAHMPRPALVQQRRPRLHRASESARWGRPATPSRRLPPPLRDPRPRPADRPRAVAAALGRLQLSLSQNEAIKERDGKRVLAETVLVDQAGGAEADKHLVHVAACKGFVESFRGFDDLLHRELVIWLAERRDSPQKVALSICCARPASREEVGVELQCDRVEGDGVWNRRFLPLQQKEGVEYLTAYELDEIGVAARVGRDHFDRLIGELNGAVCVLDRLDDRLPARLLVQLVEDDHPDIRSANVRASTSFGNRVGSPVSANIKGISLRWID